MAMPKMSLGAIPGWCEANFGVDDQDYIPNSPSNNIKSGPSSVSLDFELFESPNEAFNVAELLGNYEFPASEDNKNWSAVFNDLSATSSLESGSVSSHSSPTSGGMSMSTVPEHGMPQGQQTGGTPEPDPMSKYDCKKQRRRLQNRASQRAFRERRENLLKVTQAKVEEQNQVISNLRSTNEMLERSIEYLCHSLHDQQAKQELQQSVGLSQSMVKGGANVGL